MPELPDIEAYLSALRPRVVHQPIETLSVTGPFLVRTFEPPLDAAVGREVRAVTRIGKRIVFELDDELYLVFHLMIAGRFLWQPRDRRPPARITLATLTFPAGVLVLTEAGTKKRAALHVLQGKWVLAAHDPGGIEPLAATLDQFRQALQRERHTLKRALTDPRIFAGIGNAYSDEILHAAAMSPFQQTTKLSDVDVQRLFDAMRTVLHNWTERLLRQFADRFPGRGDITAFRDGFAVHGRFGKPCPTCRTTVQRIRYAEHETNYCPTCQTGGRVLADRSLSRLLREDWPRTIDEMESRRG